MICLFCFFRKTRQQPMTLLLQVELQWVPPQMQVWLVTWHHPLGTKLIAANKGKIEHTCVFLVIRLVEVLLISCALSPLLICFRSVCRCLWQRILWRGFCWFQCFGKGKIQIFLIYRTTLLQKHSEITFGFFDFMIEFCIYTRMLQRVMRRSPSLPWKWA